MNNVCFLLFGNSLQNAQNIHFVFFFIKVEPFYLSFHDSWNFRVFLIRAVAGTVGVMLLSRSCFPPKKVFSDVGTCFRLDISESCILKENIGGLSLIITQHCGRTLFKFEHWVSWVGQAHWQWLTNNYYDSISKTPSNAEFVLYDITCFSRSFLSCSALSYSALFFLDFTSLSLLFFLFPFFVSKSKLRWFVSFEFSSNYNTSEVSRLQTPFMHLFDVTTIWNWQNLELN